MAQNRGVILVEQASLVADKLSIPVIPSSGRDRDRLREESLFD